MRILDGPYPIEIQSYLKERTDNGSPSDYFIEYHKEALDIFRNEFAIRTVQYTTVVSIIIIIILVINRTSVHQIPLQIVGISIDLFGAGVLGRGLLSGPITLTHQSMSGHGGYNTELRDSMLQDSIDGAWGVFLLILGIAIQAVAIILKPI